MTLVLDGPPDALDGNQPQNRMQFRIGDSEDRQLLEEMLFEAVFWHPSRPRPTLREFFGNPEFARLLDGWGRNGDTAVVAEEDGEPVGAAWFRYWFTPRQCNGFVDRDTPVLEIAVKSEWRSQGIGRQLLRSLIAIARSCGIRALSLSVEPENHAVELYESEGFRKIGDSGGSWDMLIHLEDGDR